MGYRAKRNLGEPGDCEQALRRGKGRKENSANRASGAQYGSKKERKKERKKGACGHSFRMSPSCDTRYMIHQSAYGLRIFWSLLPRKNKQLLVLNTERSYKREGHAPLKRFVGFQTDQYNGGWHR